MIDDPRLGDLLLDWEEAQHKGHPVPAEELCRDCPDLLEEVRRCIHALERINPVLDLSRCEDPAGADTGASPPAATRRQSDQVAVDFTGPPPEVPGFQVLGELGRGGMGVVYKARQKGLDRLVAIKMVLTGQQISSQERARFDVEARAIARLNHPHIVQVYAVGEQEGVPYLVLEFMSGGSLYHLLHDRTLPPQQIAALLEPLARALHHAHQEGIVHRDIKPANVLLRGVRRTPDGGVELDTPKICDFGLARRLDQGRLTRPGTVVGTPTYMAPEQALKGKTSPLTDVYSLGVLLYEMLAGRVPFDYSTDWQVMQAVVGEEPVPPGQYRDDLPAALEAICLRCLHKEPAARYPSAAALADDLHRFLEGRPLKADLPPPPPPPPPAPPAPPPRLPRWRWLVGAAVAVAAAAVAAVATFAWTSGWLGGR